jgi:predicted RNase H-like nuclease
MHVPRTSPARLHPLIMYAVPTEPAPPIIIGIDLAWGGRAPSGIAVVDPSGRLLATAAVHSDEEIDHVVAPWIGSPCLVAFDAPLHVVNATGRRPCESLLTRAFAAQHAGTYPSNTGMPHFADGGRAVRLARRYDLAVDAHVAPAPGQRRGLEVYPHSATVAVFDLDQVLKYKARSGRTLATRRAALDRLVELIAGLAEPSGLPRLYAPHGFASLRQEIAAAPTGAALRRLEDPTDAILCAYVGMLFLAGRTCVIGDSETGAIVTPVQERHRALLGLPPCAAHARNPERAGSQICTEGAGSL